MKRKLKLKKWVKTTLIIIAIGVLVVMSNKQYDNAIKECVNSGHSQYFCENGLR